MYPYWLYTGRTLLALSPARGSAQRVLARAWCSSVLLFWKRRSCCTLASFSRFDESLPLLGYRCRYFLPQQQTYKLSRFLRYRVSLLSSTLFFWMLFNNGQQLVNAILLFAFALLSFSGLNDTVPCILFKWIHVKSFSFCEIWISAWDVKPYCSIRKKKLFVTKSNFAIETDSKKFVFFSPH
jgi:hypothetical protein